MSPRRVRVGVVIVSLLLFSNIFLTGYIYTELQAADSRMTELESEQQAVQNALLKTGAEQEKAQTGASANTVVICTGEFLAVEETGFVSDGNGIAVAYAYQPLAGDEIYFDVSELTVNPPFQEAVQNAQQAIDQSEYSPTTTGMRIKMSPPDDWSYIRGQSAGLEIAAELASQDPRYTRNNTVALTGVARSDGQIGSVSGITAKTVAARDQGYDTVVAPPSPTAIRVDGIQTVHVETVDAALEYALDKTEPSTHTQSGTQTTQSDMSC